MRTFDRATSESGLVQTVDVIRWEQYGLDATLPFRAMWYSVPPDTSAPRDQHPEFELSLVLTGHAYVEVDGSVTGIAQGDAFLVDSGEAHVVHNRSVDTPLLIFSAYWHPQADAGRSVTA
jgi:mannose-6-phosphate isomerase-like protein (cupin superfamily)